MVKLQRRSDPTDNYYVTIPKSLVKAKRWKPGDEMSFQIVGGEVVPQAGDILVRKVG